MNKSLEERFIRILDHQHDRNFCKKELLTLFNSSLAQYKREIVEKIEKMKLQDIEQIHSKITGDFTFRIPNSQKTKGYNQAISDVLAELEKI